MKSPEHPFLIVCFALLSICSLQAQSVAPVKVWEEPLTLPTYLIEPEEVNPMFFRGQSYQGASRVIYPYALEDNLTDKKEDRVYKALYLENEYIKLCVLPEIGGRLFYASDKTNGYEIFYRQNVIKPANIGMLGAWISGGIEFCVFHHHRASTNIPVDYRLEQNKDGSATIWIGETEPRHRMKWSLGISLFPGKSYIEVDGRLINPTENANAILYWANVATHVNNDYQIIFPPSTDFAVFHAKNSFSHWPITTETYEGNDYYKNSIDASWWKNHPNPVSFFAHNITEGFLAGYDHGKNAGTMHVANHHIVAGAKLWEWGPGAYGSMWDTRVLTDTDGPYAELMAGAYSDNQPDYSWLKPYEVKTFKQYWYPMRNTGGVVTANLHALLNLKELNPKQILVAANVTSAMQGAVLKLEHGDRVMLERVIDISPGRPFSETVALKQPLDFYQFNLSLKSTEGEELISYKPVKKQENLPLPETVKPPLPPEEIATTEELYLTGLRIRQFYNARLDATAYFLEALRRDSLDTRSNNEMGLYHKQRGEYEQAAHYFRRSIYRLAKDYTRSLTCEPFYHLGLVLKATGQLDAAYDTLYRAAWDQAFASAAYLNLAQISVQRKNHSRALEEVNKSLDYNSSNLMAAILKANMHRHLGNNGEAVLLLDDVLGRDPLNGLAMYEKYKSTGDYRYLDEWKILLRDMPEAYLENAVAYLAFGQYEEALEILQMATESDASPLSTYPTVYYYLGYILDQRGDSMEARKYFAKGRSLPTDYCFPFRLETEQVYKTALQYNPADSRAWYYLGNLLFDKQPDRAIRCWEKAVEAEPSLAIAHRNIGWGYRYAINDPVEAIAHYEQAIKHDPSQARYYYELDRLYELQGTSLEKRYEMLVKNHHHLSKRKDALLQEIKVLILAGEYETAIRYLMTNFFPRQEGVDDLHDIYVDAWLLQGLRAMESKDYAGALASFKQADQYPENHQIGRDAGYAKNPQIYYYQALALEASGNKREASKLFARVAALPVNNGVYQYYVAMSLEKTGKKPAATEMLQRMKREGEKLAMGQSDVDFFSKFGEDVPERIVMADGNFMIGLANLGLGDGEEARRNFSEAAALNPNHAWAKAYGNRL